MKNIFLKILVNLLLFIVLFTVLDFYILTKWDKEAFNIKHLPEYIESYVSSYKELHHYSFFVRKDILDQIINGPNGPDDFYRPIENENSKPEIVLFGCSFTYGDLLNDNETFSYQLAKETGYKVINRAKSGWSVQHMLFQLENDDFYKIVPKSDYVIYLHIPQHIRRVYLPGDWDKNIYYKKTKDGKLVLKQHSFNYFHTNLIGQIISWYSCKLGEFSEKELDFYFQHFTQSVENIRKHWGNDTKIIFFNYYDNYTHDDITEKYYNQMKEQGVIIVKLKDLSKTDYTDSKYKIENDGHPNAKAWREITPLFIEYLNKQGYLIPNKNK